MTFVTAPLAIAGLLGVAIPILIFLLWRQRRHPIEWGAMRFLLEAYRKHRRRLRIEQLILLAVRCLIIAVLGFALARPILQAAGVFDGTAQRVVYLVLDDGIVASAAIAPGRTSFDRQVERAIEIVDELEPGDRVGLVTAARPARTVISPPSSDLMSVAALLRNLAPTQAPTDLPGALERVKSALDDLEDESARAFVYLVSDFRAGAAPLDDRLPPALVDLDDRVVLRATPPATEPIGNVQIVALKPARSVLVPGATDGSGQVTVHLRRAGGELGNAVSRVRLAGDGLSNLAPRDVEWAPGQTEASVDFMVEVAAPREREIGITASLDADALAADDERHDVLALRKAIRVLLVDRRSFGFEPSLDRLSSGQWIRRALAPVTEGLVDVVSVEPAALDGADLQLADAVVLTRPDLVPDGAWTMLRTWVDRGGLLVVAPPAELVVHQWTDHLATTLGLPWSIERETTTSDEGRGLALQQPSSTLLRMLSNDLEALSRPVAVKTALRVDESSTQAETALRFADGDPLLIFGAPGDAKDAVGERAVSRGLVVYLAVAPELAWTNLPSKPLMVPLVQEVLRQGLSMVRAGRPIGVRTRPVLALGPAAASIVTPDGATIALEASQRPTRSLDEHGIYRVVDRANQEVGAVAVNVEPAAANVEPQPESAVQPWLAQSGPWSLLDLDDAVSDLRHADSGSPLAGLLLLALLGLILLELVLARWFSHARTVAPGGADTGGGVVTTMHERRDAATLAAIGGRA